MIHSTVLVSWCLIFQVMNSKEQHQTCIQFSNTGILGCRTFLHSDTLSRRFVILLHAKSADCLPAYCTVQYSSTVLYKLLLILRCRTPPFSLC
ncbi:hypothetical protein HOY80DRAFT_963371 [Tuber brumale]|nr:hypothetical protein HOY80DRAFT_963371 [Tuber brumale]